MGVTPEIYALDWPAGTRITAMDNNPDMIANMWPGEPEDALCCDWREMCLPDASVDMAVCDGGLIMVPYPAGTSLIVQELARVLTPGGIFACRLYLPPDPPESAADVIDDLLRGRIPSPNHLKLRLWGAVQPDPRDGVNVSDIWSEIADLMADRTAVYAATGWPKTQVDTLEPYRTSTYRYHLPSLDQTKELFLSAPGGFSVDRLETSSEHLGDRCPTIIARKL
jgi:SAM-dependent methyltransferase